MIVDNSKYYSNHSTVAEIASAIFNSMASCLNFVLNIELFENI